MPRRTTRHLTNAIVAAAKPKAGKQTDIPDAGVPGLALRVSAEGAKSWTIRYRTRNTGEQRRLTLGRYPSITLADAREAARSAIGDVAGGEDPAKAKRLSRASTRAAKLSTVGGLIESYFEAAATGRHRPNARPKRQSTLAMERYYYDRLIKPRFGALPVADLARHDVQKFLDEIGQSTTGGARHVRGILRLAYNFGIRREVVSRNPAQLSDLPAEKSRDRVLTDAELRAIWRATNDPASVDGLDVAPGTGLALMLAMVTLQRGGEVVGINAGEIDRESRLWTIPGERAKNHHTHVVPLSDLAVGILDRAFAWATGRSQWRGFAFPSPRGSGPIERHALSRAMARTTAALGIKDATAHDFRRTGATNLTGERIGIPRFIVSRVLNQISDTGGAAEATSIYDRNAYLSEKRKALDAWAALLAEITADKPRRSNVVKIKSRSR